MGWLCGRSINKIFLQAALPEAEQRVPEFKPDELALLIWALARMKYNPEEVRPLLQAAAAEATQAGTSWDIRALVQLLWCLGKFKCGSPLCTFFLPT